MARSAADDTEVIPPEAVLRAWRDQLRLVRGRLAGLAQPEADDTEVIPPEVVLRAWRDQLRLVRGRLAGLAQPEADDTEVIPPEVVLRAWRDQLCLVRWRAGRDGAERGGRHGGHPSRAEAHDLFMQRRDGRGGNFLVNFYKLF